VDVNPMIVFSSSGKKQMSAVMTTFGAMPKPSYTTMMGASASFGMA
jgi:NADH:ubiquinone oxidoreductase subunit B-like Fe-S oxidoreductase